MKRTIHQVNSASASNSATILFDIDVRSWMRRPNAGTRGINISEPREVSCYSRDGERRIDFGSRAQLSKYQDPTIGSDLGRNIETFREKTQGDFGVEPVVRALLSSTFDLMKEADFVSYRNNLNKLAGTPFNFRDEWELDAVKLADSPVFLDVRKLGDDVSSPMHKRFMYMGYYFESLCTGTQDEPVDANAEFCSIVRLRLGLHRIAFAAEIDCEGDNPSLKENPVPNYIELKTMRNPRSKRDYDNMYRNRFMKYWIQSFLAGVRTIILGVRDDNGILRKTERYNTENLHKLTRDHFRSSRGGSVWEPYVILNFLDHTLNQIRTHCESNLGRTIRVRYDPAERRVIGWILADNNFSQRIAETLSTHAVIDKNKGKNP